MAKIIIFSFSAVYDYNKWQLVSYYESFSKAFTKRGHQVLNIITNDYIVDPWNGNNISISKYIHKSVTNQIRRFNPDLIISYNNSKIKNIENVVDCPIVIAEADRWMYFSDKHELKKKVSRYHFAYFTSTGKKDLINNFGANKNQIFFIPNATSIKNKKIKKNNDINFIGSLYDIKFSQNKLEFNNAQYRFNILNKIKIFKPVIYSNNTPTSYANLKTLISSEKKYNIEQVEKVYNKSFISLNISNLQAKNIGFSWRLLDIMASNSLLITEKNKFLENHKTLKMSKKQFYDSANDCYDKMKYFLKNKSLMHDLILKQNENIKNYGSWEDRIEQIEAIFNLKVNKVKNTKNITNDCEIKILKRNTDKLDNSTLFILNIFLFILNILKFFKYLLNNILKFFKYLLNNILNILKFFKYLLFSKMKNHIKKNNYINKFLKKIYFAYKFF
jgi:hypothetical protein